MRAIDPSGPIAAADQVWWWQLPNTATQAEVRQACYRNALTEVAARSKVNAVQSSIMRVLAAFAYYRLAERRGVPQKAGHRDARLQVILNRALISRDRDVQAVSEALWREVLQHHRAEWEAEAQSLIDRWNDPTSPLHDLRRRLQGEADDE